ncbi:MAG TPA: prephenate dehydratase domain-containing protein [Pyrinomonadaceae bacterium]|nr:hypothetical protein [Chloracidobacterium sp.]HBE84142.1 hypothetical protein [Blastocatellia bacterium]HRJ90156.1 prephenate dehydratase domain-containing protein [Pyrinomonadaceae bacterium]HRK49497.1 prephenate dehydratase domain-containing protein [Pyrinomonadaceae bacterium]
MIPRVAIQGIKGSYSEEAAAGFFESEFSLVECSDFDSAFSAITSGDADRLVVPVRNQIVGEISIVTQLIRKFGLKKMSEIVLTIDHVLAAAVGMEFANVRYVSSHVEALRQCSDFFSQFPQIAQITGKDTASCMRAAVRSRRDGRAAIGSRRAAEIYGAEVLCENISNAKENHTTFHLLSSNTN